MRGTLLIAIVLLAACGSEAESDSDAGPRDEPSTDLEITFWPQGRSKGNAETWTLTCEPAGGTHRNPEDACAQLAALENPFAPPPPDEICTEQYGGPEEALVSGTYRGAPVSYELSRTNGCEIARFARLGFLLPGAAGAA